MRCCSARVWDEKYNKENGNGTFTKTVIMSRLFSRTAVVARTLVQLSSKRQQARFMQMRLLAVKHVILNNRGSQYRPLGRLLCACVQYVVKIPSLNLLLSSCDILYPQFFLFIVFSVVRSPSSGVKTLWHHAPVPPCSVRWHTLTLEACSHGKWLLICACNIINAWSQVLVTSSPVPARLVLTELCRTSLFKD